MSGLIINEEVVVFEFEEEDFGIYYENNIWIARSNDPDEEDEIIIEDLQREVKFDSSIELFGGFILTQDLFNQYKSILGIPSL